MGKPTKKGLCIVKKMKKSSLKAKEFVKTHKTKTHKIEKSEKTKRYLYNTTVSMKEFGPFDNFSEALATLFEKVLELQQQGKLSLIVLETCCWIERQDLNRKKETGVGYKLPLYFYAARDLGYELQILENGKVVREWSGQDHDVFSLCRKFGIHTHM